MKVIYAAKARIPSEFAHGHQIVQMCEALGDAGVDLTLLYPRYREVRGFETKDFWSFYGVERMFRAESLACFYWSWPARFLPDRPAKKWLTSWSEWLALLTFTLSLLLKLRAESDAIVYSRDTFPLWLTSLVWPSRARRLFFEAHTYPATYVGRWFRRRLMKCIGGFVVITGQLSSRYLAAGVSPERLLIAHDGYRLKRFQTQDDRLTSRRRFGWEDNEFVVGYAGRFHTMGMDKGIGVLVEAAGQLARDLAVRPVRLALIGGPAEDIDRLRKQLLSAGLSPEIVWYGGHVPPPAVPEYLRAFDVCTVPFPWTEHFAYYASPMKLFEYMASGIPIVATDLPAIAEIIQHGRNGLLIPPGDAPALANALRRVRDDPELASRLATQAAQDVLPYGWQHRATRILEWMGGLV
jgi:glycosyltransferase involved in cell wall biosynthesis